jgi:hypothetical protein
VVHETIDHGGTNNVVGEHLSPTPEGFVACHDQARTLVSAGNKLEEQVGCLGFERNIANFINDKDGATSAVSTLIWIAFLLQPSFLRPPVPTCRSSKLWLEPSSVSAHS